MKIERNYKISYETIDKKTKDIIRKILKKFQIEEVATNAFYINDQESRYLS